ncbi:pyridoxal phosphate-dependent transferase [Rhizophagus clarus]|uniref:Pyridoxal phosphate-dependent transferase n=1 Tax=Rhizophagus clarus TaxID=94130 RepID=A0A8H3QM16_9GLOM|nr:pyridoxal phosphate-dependent transferase [Rhizophagus clarus]
MARLIPISKFLYPFLFRSNSFRYYSTYPSSSKIKSYSDQIYDFRSDTVTKPTDEMFDIMRNASRGDDVFNEDESTYELETYIAELTGHDAALFAPSDKPNSNSSTFINTTPFELITTDDMHYAPTRVISLENTLHDGARLWNACAETGLSLQEFTRNFDSISLCLSKGIGAPIGSVLVGNKEFIKTARHLRKLFGGGWRQCGSLASAAKYAIASNFPYHLKKSHLLAKKLSNELLNLGIHVTLPVHTNMIFIDTKSINITTGELANSLASHNILISGDNSTTTRLVLHYQIPPISIEKFIDVVANIIKEKNLKKNYNVHK